MSSLTRSLDVLAYFATAEGPTLGVTEIADALQMSKAAVHRTLASFRAKGFVILDETTHRYALGPEVLLLGQVYLQKLDTRLISRDALTNLVRATSETATLSIRVGWTRVYVDQMTPDRDVKMVVQLGRHFPLHAGASSKALLAYLTAEEQAEYLRGHLERLTSHTITSRKRLEQELATIRAQGYAVSLGERDPSAGSVAAPVLHQDGTPAAVISVAGPVERFAEEVPRIATLLLEETRKVSLRLGYRYEQPSSVGNSP